MGVEISEDDEVFVNNPAEQGDIEQQIGHDPSLSFLKNMSYLTRRIGDNTGVYLKWQLNIVLGVII